MFADSTASLPDIMQNRLNVWSDSLGRSFNGELQELTVPTRPVASAGLRCVLGCLLGHQRSPFRSFRSLFGLPSQVVVGSS